MAIFVGTVVSEASCIPRADLDLRDLIGTELIMWGSDFPHPEGTWPNTEQYYKDTFSNFPEEDGRKILGGNAMGVLSAQ